MSVHSPALTAAQCFTPMKKHATFTKMLSSMHVLLRSLVLFRHVVFSDSSIVCILRCSHGCSSVHSFTNALLFGTKLKASKGTALFYSKRLSSVITSSPSPDPKPCLAHFPINQNRLRIMRVRSVKSW